MPKHRSRSVDAQFQVEAGRVMHSVFDPKSAPNSSMTDCSLSVVWVLSTNAAKCLTLRWHWLSQWGREHFIQVLACDDGQYLDNVYVQLNNLSIPMLTWHKIVEAPLTLILPWVYPPHAIIWFCIVHHIHWFGRLSSVFVYFLLDHNKFH